MCPTLINHVSDAFKLALENNGELPNEKTQQNSLGIRNVIQKNKNDHQHLRGHLLLMVAFHEMLKSSSFKQKLVKGPFIELLAMIIDKSDQC